MSGKVEISFRSIEPLKARSGSESKEVSKGDINYKKDYDVLSQRDYREETNVFEVG